jgi:hypothetical protein
MIKNLEKIIREREGTMGQITKTPSAGSSGDIKEIEQLISQSHEYIMKSLKIMNDNQKELYEGQKQIMDKLKELSDILKPPSEK